MYGNNLEHINTKESAYILGLMYADGYLKNGALALKESDLDILQKIATYTGCNQPKYIRPQENRYSDNGQYRIFLGKEKYHLVKHLGENKEKLPILPSALKSHFIRGIFDGDGCISLDQRYINKYPDSAIPADFFILFNSYDHAKTIQNWIIEATANNKTKIISKQGQGKQLVWKIRWGGTSSILSIRDWLYHDADFFITRKKEIFDHVRAGNKSMAAHKAALARYAEYEYKSVTWQCLNCSKDLTTSPSKRKKYCSRKCANTFSAALRRNS